MKGKFNTIKKSRKKSKDIDEKIEYLNKECQKTGLQEVMTTSNIYQGSTKVPNQDYINFNGLSQGGYALGLSGADGNSLGNATIGINPSTGQSGVALSPPHPVSGTRRVASTVTDGVGSNRSLRPGIGTRVRGTNDDGSPRVINDGSAVWFFHQPTDQWYNFEYLDGELGFWDTNFLGFFFHNTNLDEFQLSGVNVGTQIKNKIAPINFGADGEIGAPQTTVLVQNDLSDPGFLPINIKDLSKQAFDFLKNKAQDLLDKAKDFGDTIDWENVKDTGSKIASTIWAGAKLLSGLGKGKKLLADFIADYTINPLVDKAFGFSVADSAGEYNKKLLTSLGVTTATGKNQEIKLSDKAKKDLINNIDIDMLRKHMTIGSTPTIDANNAVNPGKGKQNGLLKGAWGNQGGSHINYDPDTGKFTVTMVKMLRDFGELDEKSAGGKITNFHDIPSPTPEQLRKQFSKVQLDKLFKFAGKYHPLRLGGFSGDDIAYGMTTQFEGFTKAAYNLAIQGTASNIVHFRNEALKLGVPKSEIEEMGAGFGGYVYSQVEYLGNDIPGGVTSGVRGVVTDRMKTHLGISESKNITLSEEAKLGHFDPEVLTVDINDIRKGIMPEFPKDPPPEMINGYSAKSKLAPKKIEGSPFINITKKDLARNHKLTDKEISDFMNDINMINDYIKKNPADLIYAQQRYPKHDPRLAQLNWQMDQMKAASEEYMETHFPENQKLFSKLQDKIIRNIKQTDPKNFTGHREAPKFTDNNVEMSEQRKKTVLKYFKKSVKIKKPFKY